MAAEVIRRAVVEAVAQVLVVAGRGARRVPVLDGVEGEAAGMMGQEDALRVWLRGGLLSPYRYWSHFSWKVSRLAQASDATAAARREVGFMMDQRTEQM